MLVPSDDKPQGMQDHEQPEFERHLAIFWARWRSGFAPTPNDHNAWWLAFRQYPMELVMRTFDRLYKTFDTGRMPNCNQALELAESLAKSDYYSRQARRALPAASQPEEPTKHSESGKRAASEMIDLMEAQHKAGVSREEAAKARFALIYDIIGRSPSLKRKL